MNGVKDVVCTRIISSVMYQILKNVWRDKLRHFLQNEDLFIKEYVKEKVENKIRNILDGVENEVFEKSINYSFSDEQERTS